MKKARLKKLSIIFSLMCVLAFSAYAQDADEISRANKLIEEAQKILENATYENLPQLFAKTDEAAKIFAEAKDEEGLRRANGFKGLGFNMLGFLYLGDEKYDKATENFQKSLNIFNEIDYAFGRGLVFHNLGIVAVRTKDEQSAVTNYEQAVKNYTKSGEPENAAIVLRNLGYLFEEKNEKARAIGYFEKALEIKRDSSDREMLAEILEKLGDWNLNLEKYKEAEKYYAEVLPIFRELKNAEKVSFTLHNLGVAVEKSDKESAVAIYEQAGKAYRETKNPGGEAIVMRNIALVRYDQGNYSEARKYFEESLALYIGSKDRNNESLLLNDLGDNYYAEKNYGKALEYYEKSLNISRELKDRQSEADNLSDIGFTHQILSHPTDAMKAFEEAGKIYRELGGENQAMLISMNLGLTYLTAARYEDAKKLLEEALAFYRKTGDEPNQATALFGLAGYYQYVGKYIETYSLYDQTIALYRKFDNKAGIADTLINQGVTLNAMNRSDEALGKLSEAQEIYREMKSRLGEASIYLKFGSVYSSISKFQDALENYEMAAKIGREIGNSNIIAEALGEKGAIYDGLGDYPKSVEYYQKSLELYRKIGDRYGEAMILNNLGFSYFKQEKYAESKKYLEQSVKTFDELKLELYKGYAVHNIGLIYYKLGDFKKALPLYDEAGEIYTRYGDNRPLSYLYDSYGELYRDLGQFDKAQENLESAVSLSRIVKHRAVEANALNNLMLLWEKQKQTRIAIFYGKQAVNLLQSVRNDNQGLDKNSQKTLVQSYEKVYRKLADLLISEGRLPEAQKVMEMLKEKEYSDFLTRDADEAASLAKVSERPDEKEALEKYSRYSKTLAADGAELVKLETEKNNLKDGETFKNQARYDELKTRIEAANKAFRILLEKTLSADLDKDKIKDIKTDRALQGKLAKWGNGTVAVRTLIAEDRYRVILTTPKTQVDGKTEIKAADLNKKISDFRQILLDPTLDPRPLGKELYDILVKPVEANLENADAKTLLWSLDGALGYIPVGTLYDGEKYLAEKYQNVVVTSTTRASLDEETNKDWRVLGAGVTGSSEVKEPFGTGKIPFKALPAVGEELQTIVKTEGGKGAGGILPGLRLVDSTFTESALKENVASRIAGERKYNVIHFATHFRLGNLPENSFLLLGNNEILTLEEVNDSTDLELSGIELVTLSACNTGFGGISGISEDNKAIDSLAAFIESRGAKSVIATLWAVNDESTALLMSEFYRLRKGNPNITKAEALQTAQKMMISGELKPSKNGKDDRSGVMFQNENKPNAPKFTADPNKPFAHPLYWSPFVLIGNWR